MQNSSRGGGPRLAPGHVRAGTTEAPGDDTVPAPGPWQGFTPGTPIMTLDGPIAVDCLRPGDRIITRDSGMRRLRGLVSRVHGDLGAVVLGASALGHGRPAGETLVGPDQGILLRDWRARTLYRRDAALVPAARLVDGHHVTRAPVALRLRLFQLLFDADHVIYAGGIECAALRPQAGARD